MEYQNPYEANPAKIPASDHHVNKPHYGRYLPHPADFKPAAEHINSTTPESIAYWSDILSQCNESHRIYENIRSGRDVFAFGSLIIKSSHLKKRAGPDCTLVDANEVAATNLVKEKCSGIRVPKIYFADKINGRSVLVQERILGVGLDVAWQYLTKVKKTFFIDEARDILRKLRDTIKPDESQTAPSYIVPDPAPRVHRGISMEEHDIMFGTPAFPTGALCFVHNGFWPANLIVIDGEIVGVVDWEMAGYFPWLATRSVHLRVRSPDVASCARLTLDEDSVKDVLRWEELFNFS
ncbi:hypothetical protein K4F52_008977 [Lecanicillium sp. MT-2017a]|nr:hypothetical protein K4F52_008977 [Lecanicillium sp. MT-2017a]